MLSSDSKLRLGMLFPQSPGGSLTYSLILLSLGGFVCCLFVWLIDCFGLLSCENRWFNMVCPPDVCGVVGPLRKSSFVRGCSVPGGTVLRGNAVLLEWVLVRAGCYNSQGLARSLCGFLSSHAISCRHGYSAMIPSTTGTRGQTNGGYMISDFEPPNCCKINKTVVSLFCFVL